MKYGILRHNSIIIFIVMLTILLTLVSSVFILSKCSQMQTLETNKLASIVEEWIDKEGEQVVSLRNTIEHLKYNADEKEELYSFLKMSSDKNDRVCNYYVVFPDNSGVFSSGFTNPENFPLIERPYYKKAQSAKDVNDPYVSNVYIDADSKQAVFTISLPLYIDGNFVGVFAADMFTTDLSEVLQDSFYDGSGKAIIIDRDNNVFVHGDASKMTSSTNGILSYSDVGVPEELLMYDTYMSMIGPNRNIYSAIRNTEYGYSVIAVTSGLDYYGSVLIFFAICCVVLAAAVLYAWKDEQRTYTIQDKVLQDAFEAAETDGLTGLFNRTAGERRVSDLVSEQRSGMFCFIDIDRFKSINDEFGHDVGDAAILYLTGCLRQTFSPADVLIRFGGDEFAVFACDISSEEAGIKLFRKFFEILDDDVVPGLVGRKLSVSAGAVFVSENYEGKFNDLYVKADKLLYESKMHTGNYLSI